MSHPVQSAKATLSSVASSAASVTLFVANPARRLAIVHNDSTATLYIAYAAAASAAAFTAKLPADAYWEMPQPAYTGLITGIWSAANGNARCTETT